MSQLMPMLHETRIGKGVYLPSLAGIALKTHENATARCLKHIDNVDGCALKIDFQISVNGAMLSHSNEPK